MKIALLIDGLEAFYSRYRVFQYIPYLKKKRMEIFIHLFKHWVLDKLDFCRTLEQLDIPLIQGKLFLPKGYRRTPFPLR